MTYTKSSIVTFCADLVLDAANFGDNLAGLMGEIPGERDRGLLPEMRFC